ncbi:MAG: hypothetical protein ABGX12_00685 [Desulfurobacteriaceae bacterium]
MGFFNLFKRKSEEELFREAVASKDYVKVVEIAEKLLLKHPDSLSLLNTYTDALIKLGKKEKALKEIISFAEKKLKEEYYDVAIPLLKKALKLDPANVEALKLLTSAYTKKELYYEAFDLLIDSYKKLKEKGENTAFIKDKLEEFAQSEFHPLFYERFSDLLREEGTPEDTEKAFVNYVLAANLYSELKNYSSALRVLLKALKIKHTENLDKQLIDVLSHVEEEKAEPILKQLLLSHKNDLDFIKFTVNSFRENNKLRFLKKLAESLAVPKLKYAILTFVNFELGEFEEGQDYLDKLKLIDRDLYERIKIDLQSRYPDIVQSEYFGEAQAEEIPEPDEILEELDKVINFDEAVIEYTADLTEYRKPEKLSEEINALKKLEGDGIKNVSVAEALLGMGKFEEAMEEARKALNSPNAFRAIMVIVDALKHLGRYREALTFLFDAVKNPNLTPDQVARLKVAVGEMHELSGDKEKALIWYKEAQKSLNDPDLAEKISALEAKAGSI